MTQFRSITNYLKKLQGIEYGKMMTRMDYDEEKDESYEAPCVYYTEPVQKFSDKVLRFCINNNYFGFADPIFSKMSEMDRQEILDFDLSDVDDPLVVLALLFFIVSIDWVQEGSLLEALESGVIIKWLTKLKELDGKK